MAPIVIVVLVLVGLFVFAPVSSLLQRKARASSAHAKLGVQRAAAIGPGVVVVLMGYLLLVGNFSSSLHPIPTFTSLQTQPDSTLLGTVAYNALPVGSP